MPELATCAGRTAAAKSAPDELARLRAFAAATEQRHTAIRSVLACVDAGEQPEAFALGMTVLALLDGPAPSAQNGAQSGTFQRRTVLLAVIRAQGGRWKTGRVVALYRQIGYGGFGRQTATDDLKALCDGGHLVQHDEAGVRYYTLKTAPGRKGTR